MSKVLDGLLVTAIVLSCLAYASYALGPSKLKTWMLAQIGRYLGLRALSFVLRRSSSGCDGCSAAGKHSPANRNLRPLN